MKVLNKFIKSFLFVFAILLLGVPIIFLFYLAFMKSNFVQFPVETFSFRWFSQIFYDDTLLLSLGFSLIISLIVAVISCIIGFFSGYGLSRSNFKTFNKNLIIFIMTLPALIPLILYGFSFLEFSRLIHFTRTPVAIIIAHVVVFSPLVFTYLYFVFNNLNEDLEFAALELGAKSKDLFFLLLAQVKFNLLVSFSIVFLLSWDEYILSWFLGGFMKTYAVQVRNMMESTFSPEIFSIGAMIALLSFSLIFLSIKLVGNSKAKQIV